MASREKQKPGDPLEYWIMVCCLCSTKLADVACDILCLHPDYNQQIIAADSKFKKHRGGHQGQSWISSTTTIKKFYYWMSFFLCDKFKFSVLWFEWKVLSGFLHFIKYNISSYEARSRRVSAKNSQLKFCSSVQTQMLKKLMLSWL